MKSDQKEALSNFLMTLIHSMKILQSFTALPIAVKTRLPRLILVSC